MGVAQLRDENWQPRTGSRPALWSSHSWWPSLCLAEGSKVMGRAWLCWSRTWSHNEVQTSNLTKLIQAATCCNNFWKLTICSQTIALVEWLISALPSIPHLDSSAPWLRVMDPKHPGPSPVLCVKQWPLANKSQALPLRNNWHWRFTNTFANSALWPVTESSTRNSVFYLKWCIK